MTASCNYICECGHVLARIPVRPARESTDETVHPAEFRLTCRNRRCEHCGEVWVEPLSVVELRRAVAQLKLQGAA